MRFPPTLCRREVRLAKRSRVHGRYAKTRCVTGGAILEFETRSDVAATSPVLRAAAIASAVLVVGYAIMVLTGWPNTETIRVLTDVGFPAAGLIYVPLAARAAHSSLGRTRSAWLALTVAFAFWAVAELLWTYYEYAGEVPYPSWADVFYLLYVPCVALALLLFPDVGTWRDRSRLIVDGTIITGAFFLISWLTVMRSIWQERGDSR